MLTRLMTRNQSAEQVMRYCWDTVDQCVAPDVVLGALADAGFALARQKVVVGIFCEYSATRPETVARAEGIDQRSPGAGPARSSG